MRTAFISFLECEVRGNWDNQTDVGKLANIYISKDEDGDVHLVRPDG
jgi:hypothetical protein